MTAENAAARKWVPWLCAYTGARVNENTQLRASDVKAIDGIPCIHITPEAGTVKTVKERTVPLHPHLEEMGFLVWARCKRGKTPLFYSLARQRNPDRKNPTYTLVGNKLGFPATRRPSRWNVRMRSRENRRNAQRSCLLDSTTHETIPGPTSGGDLDRAESRGRRNVILSVLRVERIISRID